MTAGVRARALRRVPGALRHLHLVLAVDVQVGGDDVEVRTDDRRVTLAALHPALADVQWLADRSGGMGRRLAPQAVATVIGLRGSGIEWDLAGVMTEPSHVKSLVTAWLTR